MGWVIAAFIILGLAILPLRVILLYDQDGFFAVAKIWLFKIQLVPFPVKKSSKKEKKTDSSDDHEDDALTKAKDKARQALSEVKTEKKGGKLQDFIPFIKLGCSLLNDFRRKLVICDLRLKLILAGGDPCNLALNYGRTWTALGNLMPRLERFLTIKKRDIQAECDFEGTQTTVFFLANIKITFGRCVCLAVKYGYKAIIEFIHLKKSRKGGAQA